MRDEVVMVGGYVCRLSPAERNAWHEFVEKTEEYRRYMDCWCDYQSILSRQRAISDDLAGLFKERVGALHEASHDLHRLAKTWVQSHIGEGALE